MERKAEYIQRLKSELDEVDSDIKKLINRSDKIAVEIKQGYDVLETALLDKQSSTQKVLNESSMSHDEVWGLVWVNVWVAINEFNSQAAADIKQLFQELEPSLKSKQSVIQGLLDESEMTAGEIFKEIWKEVWSEFWNIVGKIDRKAAVETKQIGDELETLELKKSALTIEIHELLMTGDETWNVSKEITRAMVEGTACLKMD